MQGGIQLSWVAEWVAFLWLTLLHSITLRAGKISFITSQHTQKNTNTNENNNKRNKWKDKNNATMSEFEKKK